MGYAVVADTLSRWTCLAESVSCVRVVMITRKPRKHKNVRTPMTDTTRTLVVGMMLTPSYDWMFEQSRRVYKGSGANVAVV